MVSCKEFALERLQDKPISAGTVRSYLQTLRALRLEELDVELVNANLVAMRLSEILTASTRRKHAVNIRAVFGIKVKAPKATQKVYTLPPTHVLHAALVDSNWTMHGFAMLYAGLRLGEASTNQQLIGNRLKVDRQRREDNTLVSAKTSGEVIVPDWFAEAYTGFDFDKHPHSVYMGIRRALKRGTGIKLTPHALRHAFATNLVKAGASPEVLRRQMRHSDIALALRFYVQTTDQDVQRVIDLQQMCTGNDTCMNPACQMHGDI